MSENKVDKKTMNKVFLRSFLYGASWNYERMQNLGFLYTILPVLKKVYKHDDKKEIGQAMTRHLEFFNTHPTAAPFIIGVSSAIENQEKNVGGESNSALKTGLMGPLAGVGDSMVGLTLVPIIFSIGASYAKTGNPIGLLIALGLFNLINIPLRYYGLKFGFSKGSELIQKEETRAGLDNITKVAVALGLILIGGLIPQWVGVKFAFSFQQGDLTVSLQEIIDKMIPGIVPLLLTLFVYRLIKKGYNPVLIIFGMMIMSVILVSLGILG